MKTDASAEAVGESRKREVGGGEASATREGLGGRAIRRRVLQHQDAVEIFRVHALSEGRYEGDASNGSVSLFASTGIVRSSNDLAPVTPTMP